MERTLLKMLNDPKFKDRLEAESLERDLEIINKRLSKGKSIDYTPKNPQGISRSMLESASSITSIRTVVYHAGRPSRNKLIYYHYMQHGTILQFLDILNHSDKWGKLLFARRKAHLVFSNKWRLVGSNANQYQKFMERSLAHYLHSQECCKSARID